MGPNGVLEEEEEGLLLMKYSTVFFLPCSENSTSQNLLHLFTVEIKESTKADLFK